MERSAVHRLLKAAIGHLDSAKDCLRRARDEPGAGKMEMVTAWDAADRAVESVRAVMHRITGTERGQT